MRMLSKITLTAVAVLALAAVLAPDAQAACGGNPIIGTNSGVARSFIWNPAGFTPGYYPGYPPYSYPSPSPARPPLSPNASAIFWSMQTGDPILGPGDDSGAWNHPPYPWVYAIPSYYGGWYAAEIFAGWGASSTIDGCIQNNAPNWCTCVLITDHDGVDSYFAIASNNALSGTWQTWLTQPGLDGAGNAAPIILAQVPKATITWTARKAGLLDLDITGTIPAVVGGVYPSGGTCPDCVPKGFKLYEIILPRGSAPPGNRDIVAGGWSAMNLVGGGAQPWTPLGSPVTVESICGAADTDVWVGASLVFDGVGPSVWETGVVSGNATRIECGPNVAEPEPVRIRPDTPKVLRGTRERSR